MKTIASFLMAAAATVAGTSLSIGLQAADQSPVRVLVVTGGHGYDTNAFRATFTDLPGVQPVFAAHPDAHAWFAADRAEGWDVCVLYDMWQPITEEAKRDFRERFRSGKGLVALHHALANYQDWPLYAQIIGGAYHLDSWERDGVAQPGSTYQHDVDFKVQVLNPWHPVTLGMEDFVIHDETYGRLELKPVAKPLLAVQHPTSSPVVAWAKQWQQARVVGIQLGHDHQAYANPHFQRLLGNAIRWVAPRD